MFQSTATSTTTSSSGISFKFKLKFPTLEGYSKLPDIYHLPAPLRMYNINNLKKLKFKLKLNFEPLRLQ